MKPAIWRPQPADDAAPIESPCVRIVDFGADFLRGGDGQPRHHFHCHRYRLLQDAKTGLWHPNDRPVKLDLNVDVDGDGRSDDDVVAYHAFSLTRPFNPVAPWYDTRAGTPRWYGGQAIFQANRRDTGFSEDGVNQDHDGPFCWPRENWAVFHEYYDIYSPYRLAANWLWLKHDFLNGGADCRVSFDDRSRLALVLKRYFMCVDSVRFLVRDGKQCFLSEKTFSLVGTHTLRPNRTRWAEYSPMEPHDIYFDADSARFESRTFDDVTAVGVYVSKDRFMPAYFGYKWYAFEADAVVHRRKRPSESIAMTKVAADDGDFYFSKTEVPYVLWKDVFRRARDNNFVPPSQGFTFDKDGDCGSMDFGHKSHSLNEPATDFTLLDTLAWCNALSELESREPVYYEDAAFKKPFHEVCWSPAFSKTRPIPELHVKWAADGYRLPTAGEWQAAWRSHDRSHDDAVVEANSNGKTQPVGVHAATSAAICDLLGNVWEPIWTFRDVLKPAQSPPITLVGGDFLYPSDPVQRSASRYGDSPYDGSYNIGLRLVRRKAGGAAPADEVLESDIPVWTIHADDVTNRPISESSTKSKGNGVRTQMRPDPIFGAFELVRVPNTSVEIARRETTFSLWKEVRDWGERHGYRTDYDGDMGSMDYWGFDPVSGAAEPPRIHGPTEPATDMTAYDMAVWCNALSEMTGRRPVYYSDTDCQSVYRTAVKYRPIQFHFPDDYLAKYGPPDTSDTPAVGMGAGASQSLPGVYASDAMQRVLPPLYIDATADGFRLPTVAEYQQAVVPDGSQYPWGDNAVEASRFAWLFDTAMGTTHAVGQKASTRLGLFDVLGNVSELSSPGVATRMRTVRLGGSFLDLTVGLRSGLLPADAPPTTWPYCDTGFRVVRQIPTTQSKHIVKASIQTAGATRVESTRTPDASGGTTQLKIDPGIFDSLIGTVHRGNLQRTGWFDTTGVRDVHGVKWRFQTGGPVKSSPVVVDGLVCVGSNDRSIYALDKKTGKLVWKSKTGGAVSGSAAVVDGVVYMASEDGRLYALDAKTGESKWITPFSKLQPCGSPAVAYGVVFIGTGAKGGHETGIMTAGPLVGLDWKTGKIVWHGPSGPQGYAAICLDATTLYAGVNGSNYGAVDLGTGKSRWTANGGQQNRQFMSFTRHGELAYVPGSMTGTVMAWDPQLGRTRWHVPIWPGQTLPINNGGRTGYEVYADLAVAYGRVYAGCNDGKLHTFDAETGKRGWEFDAASAIQSSPSVANQTVYFGSWDGIVFALDALTGRLRWRMKPSDLPSPGRTTGSDEPSARIISSPWPDNGVLYIGCDDGNVFAIE